WRRASDCSRRNRPGSDRWIARGADNPWTYRSYRSLSGTTPWCISERSIVLLLVSELDLQHNGFAGQVDGVGADLGGVLGLGLQDQILAAANLVRRLHHRLGGVGVHPRPDLEVIDVLLGAAEHDQNLLGAG